MRYLQKVWKWLFGIIVVLIFCLPVVFLLAGSLKGTKELTDSLGAVIAGKEETYSGTSFLHIQHFAIM